MKKLLILSFLILGFTLQRFNVYGAIFNDTQTNNIYTYVWGMKDSNDYLVEPLGLAFDFSNTDLLTHFNQMKGVSFGAYSTSGTMNRTVGYVELFIEFYYGTDDSLFIVVRGDAYGLSSYSYLGQHTFYDISNEIPLLMIGFDFLSNTNNSTLYEDRSISLRFGSQTSRISWSSQGYTSLTFHDHLDASSTYDPGVKFLSSLTYRAYSTINPVTLFATTDLYISNISSVNSLILDRLIDLGYDLGYELGETQGFQSGINQVNGLLDVASLVVGVVISFVLFLVQIEVFGISIFSVFSTLFLIVGIVWILKAIRG